MLEHELYERTGPDSFRLLPESVVYPAHFPGWPVTPGVCLLRIVTEILYPGKRIAAARSLRFLTPVLPGDELRIEKTEKGSILLLRGETLCAKMTVTYV